MRPRLGAFLLAVLAFAPLLVRAQATPAWDRSDWEREQARRNWTEDKVALPPYPKGDNLVKFDVPAARDFSFFIDPASLSDGIVRYTLVARSTSGAKNVSFEGIHCASDEYKVYATGRSNGTWLRHETPWRDIGSDRVQYWHNELSREYLCPSGRPVANAKDALSVMRRGGPSGPRPF